MKLIQTINVLTKTIIFLAIWFSFAFKLFYYTSSHKPECIKYFDGLYPVAKCMVSEHQMAALTAIILSTTMLCFLCLYFKAFLNMLKHNARNNKSPLQIDHANFIHKLALKNYKSKSWNKNKVADYVKEVFNIYLEEEKTNKHVHPLELKPIEELVVLENKSKSNAN